MPPMRRLGRLIVNANQIEEFSTDVFVCIHQTHLLIYRMAIDRHCRKYYFVDGQYKNGNT